MQDPTDPLSPLARKILKLDPNAFGRLVVPGDGSPDAKAVLEKVRPHELMTGLSSRSDELKSMLAGLWLYHDWLDESHRISQSIDTPTGSFWHAILHRREGDFSNSKYWYARCANHPSMAPLGVAAAGVLNAQPADKALLRIIMAGWNADAFVDLVEQVHDDPSDSRHALAVTLQRLEWQTLFDHCTRAAAG